VASVRKYQKLHLCPTEPVPASSKTDPPLDKAEPISSGGRTCVITYLRRGKKLLSNSNRERGVRICERNNSSLEHSITEGLHPVDRIHGGAVHEEL